MKEEYRQDVDEGMEYFDCLQRLYDPNHFRRAFSRLTDLSEMLRQYAGAYCCDSRGALFSVLWDYVQLIYVDLAEVEKTLNTEVCRDDSGSK